jgi:mRNA interferase YafQ
MRTIERTAQFKKDYKREQKGAHRHSLERDFLTVLTALLQDKPLEARYRDHALGGEWKDHRDCHIKPDLVLIYSKPNKSSLKLVRLGSHSELAL